MILSRRHLLAGGLSVAGLSALAACSPKTVKSGSLEDLTLRAATYRGNLDAFFQQAGVADTPYKVAKSEFAGGNLIAEAINAGALDIGGMSEIPPIFVAGAPGNQVRIVAVLQGDVNNQVVLVPKDSKAQVFADLKGKRIGYVKATTSHYILLRLLDEAGLKWTDIQPVALSPQDGLAAFSSGAIDAWVIYGVIVQQARQAGARVLRTALGILSGNYLVAAAKSALDDPLKRQALGDYLGRYAKVVEWSNADDARWAQARSAATGVPAALYLREFKERSALTRLVKISDAAIASQQGVADAFATAGLIPAKVDVRPLWDDRLNSALPNA
ncbi:ABC transporter substrate-binding protein [Caulobacter soli]|uniref:ABC transporter substrate-binding protein n=1 Tax=Caulobacter soli TaxID=2708539 RepID=UPI0013EB6CD6|nr:ABC transporter substrate-binding protein [Caulobacter soli]